MKLPFYLRPFLYLIPFLLFGCQQGEEGSDYTLKNGRIIYKGELSDEVRVHMQEEPQSLHPTNSTLAQAEEILGLVYERLLQLDMESGELRPVLVKDLPEVSEDQLSYSFELREEARWQDGSPITAEDIAFNFKLLVCKQIENEAFKAYAEYFEDMEIDADNPRKFTLKMSQTYFLNPYFGVLAFMINPQFYDPQGVLSDFSLKELMEGAESEALLRWAEEFNDIKYGRRVELLQGGSGPYRLREWLPDQGIVLEARDDYWAKDMEGRPFEQEAPEIRFRIIKDPQALVEAIRQQDIDISTKLSPSAYEQLVGDSLVNAHYQIDKQSRSSLVLIILNNRPDGISQAPIFDDIRVRQALAYALPMDEILYKRLETDYIRASAPPTPGNPHADADLLPFAYDSSAARRLLDEAGWTDQNGDGVREKEIDGRTIPLTFSLNFPPQNTTIVQMLEQFEIAWQQVGIKVELQPQDMRAYIPKIQSGQFDASLLPLRSSANLPFDYKQNYDSESWPEGGNFFGYANPETDSLIDLIRITADEKLRKEMAYKVNRILAEEVPGLFLYHPTRKMALHKRYSNGSFYPMAPFVPFNALKVYRN